MNAFTNFAELCWSCGEKYFGVLSLRHGVNNLGIFLGNAYTD